MKKKQAKSKPLVAVVMGSKSDLDVMKRAAHFLDQFKVPYEIRILSAHRTPQAMAEFAESAERRGFEVIIAGAGGAAHLPGMIAALTPLPVIGVPVLATPGFDGLDSLLSIAQMPEGVPVATVAVNGAGNAGLLAVQILSGRVSGLRGKFANFKNALKKKIKNQNQKLKRRPKPVR
jgi:phosphoribosylaminoimidazole carboxylase PurE protein